MLFLIASTVTWRSSLKCWFERASICLRAERIRSGISAKAGPSLASARAFRIFYFTTCGGRLFETWKFWKLRARPYRGTSAGQRLTPLRCISWYRKSQRQALRRDDETLVACANLDADLRPAWPTLPSVIFDVSSSPHSGPVASVDRKNVARLRS